MNSFEITPTTQTGTNEVKITICRSVEPTLIPALRAAYEQPIRQGICESLPEDCVRYVFYLDDDDAAELRDVLRMVYATASGYYTVN